MAPWRAWHDPAVRKGLAGEWVPGSLLSTRVCCDLAVERTCRWLCSLSPLVLVPELLRGQARKHEISYGPVGTCPHCLCISCVLGTRPREVHETQYRVPGNSQTSGAGGVPCGA